MIFITIFKKGQYLHFLPESQEQNFIVMDAFLEAAKRFARGDTM